MTRARAFLQADGDAYYERNKADFGKTDLVSVAMENCRYTPHRVLEVGCANGWRLGRWRDQYGCEVRGIEPSRKAVDDGNRLLGPVLTVGTADRLPYDDAAFDVVIMGFFLWLVEPGLWFRVVAEADRVLAANGIVIVHDYIWPRGFEARLKSEAGGLPMWGHDFPELWLAHPWYRRIWEETAFIDSPEIGWRCEAATVLFKGSEMNGNMVLTITETQE